MKRAFFGEIKSIFHTFSDFSFDEIYKNREHKFQVNSIHKTLYSKQGKLES